MNEELIEPVAADFFPQKSAYSNNSKGMHTPCLLNGLFHDNQMGGAIFLVKNRTSNVQSSLWKILNNSKQLHANDFLSIPSLPVKYPVIGSLNIF